MTYALIAKQIGDGHFPTCRWHVRHVPWTWVCIPVRVEPGTKMSLHRWTLGFVNPGTLDHREQQLLSSAARRVPRCHRTGMVLCGEVPGGTRPHIHVCWWKNPWKPIVCYVCWLNLRLSWLKFPCWYKGCRICRLKSNGLFVESSVFLVCLCILVMHWYQ